MIINCHDIPIDKRNDDVHPTCGKRDPIETDFTNYNNTHRYIKCGKHVENPGSVYTKETCPTGSTWIYNPVDDSFGCYDTNFDINYNQYITFTNNAHINNALCSKFNRDARCTETAETSVTADASACEAVANLDTAAECESVMTDADSSARACTYTPALNYEVVEEPYECYRGADDPNNNSFEYLTKDKSVFSKFTLCTHSTNPNRSTLVNTPKDCPVVNHQKYFSDCLLHADWKYTDVSAPHYTDINLSLIHI